jgi:hypothetical protein
LEYFVQAAQFHVCRHHDPTPNNRLGTVEDDVQLIKRGTTSLFNESEHNLKIAFFWHQFVMPKFAPPDFLFIHWQVAKNMVLGC